AEGGGAPPPLGRVAQLNEVEYLLDPGERKLGGECEHPEVIAAAAGGVEVVRFEHRSDAADRLLELAVATAEDERLARGWLGQAEQHAQRGGLSGAVRAEVAGDRPRPQREGDVVDDGQLAVTLPQSLAAHDRLTRGRRDWRRNAELLVGHGLSPRFALHEPIVAAAGLARVCREE